MDKSVPTAAPPRVQTLAATRADAVTSVLCEAFFDYPVMRYVLGPQADYAERLTRLIGLLTAGRWQRGHPVLGLDDALGQLCAVVTLTPRGEFDTPPALKALAESTWSALGEDARQRYARLCEAWAATEPAGPHWHVNMLGVRPPFRGSGQGARLLSAALDLAASDPGAEALDLTTEDAANLAFYGRRGFEITGHRRVDAALETWTLVASVGPRRT